MSTTKNLGLFSSFLKRLLRNVGSTTQRNLGGNWCQVISEEWLRILYNICKAKPNLPFKLNCTVLFANCGAPEGAWARQLGLLMVCINSWLSNYPLISGLILRIFADKGKKRLGQLFEVQWKSVTTSRFVPFQLPTPASTFCVNCKSLLFTQALSEVNTWDALNCLDWFGLIIAPSSKQEIKIGQWWDEHITYW